MSGGLFGFSNFKIKQKNQPKKGNSSPRETIQRRAGPGNREIKVHLVSSQGERMI